MDYSSAVIPLVIKGDKYIKDIIELLSPLYKKEFGVGQDVTVPLFMALHSTSESILILIEEHAIFDADVLLRTVMEGTIKYCYLLTGNQTQRKEKYEEYRYKLTDIDKVSDHYKAEKTIEILTQFSTNSTKPFESYLLEYDKLEELQKLYSKKLRAEIKEKWSYQHILKELALQDDLYKAQLGTFSTYSLTSHFIHCDWTGLSMWKEHIDNIQLISNEDYDICHAIRILSNVLGMYLFRVLEYARGNNFINKELYELYNETYLFVTDLSAKQNEIINAYNEGE